MKLVIVDDERLVRESLAQLCSVILGWEVAEAGNEAEALKMIKASDPDVVLLDIYLGHENGLGVARQIQAMNSRALILLMSGRCDARTIWCVEKARVCGFIDKNESGHEFLKKALENTAAGLSYFSPNYLRLVQERRNDPTSFDKVLSDREQAVLGLIGKGLDNQEIAEKLGAAWHTVDTHRKRVMKKLGIRTSTKLVKYSIENGFTQFLVAVCIAFVPGAILHGIALIIDFGLT